MKRPVINCSVNIWELDKKQLTFQQRRFRWDFRKIFFISTVKLCNVLLREPVKSSHADCMTNICRGWSWQTGDLASKWGDCLNGLWSPIPVHFPVPVNFLCACLLFAHCKKYDGFKAGGLKVCLWRASVLLCSTPAMFPHLVLKFSLDEVTRQELPSVSASPEACLEGSWATRALRARCQQVF